MDANGIERSADTDKIFSISGDIEDANNNGGIAMAIDRTKNRVERVHDTVFVDSEGEVIDPEQALEDHNSGTNKITALQVQIEATHSGDNHNYCVYYEDSMERDAESFVNPFNKPVLKNHNSYSGEPLGRIMKAWAGPSELTDERAAIHLITKITDKDAIPKFMDGRYRTVSISGTIGTATCNICGKTILKDGVFNFCGHWRGDAYNKKMCYWGARDIEYHEVSTVNNPADDYAQVMKITVLTDKCKKSKKKEEKDMNGNQTQNDSQQPQAAPAQSTTITEDARKQLNDIIDQILSGNKQQVQDNSAIQEPTAPANNEQQEAPADGTTDANAELQKKLTDAQAEIDKLKKEVADAQAERDNYKNQFETMKTECDSYKEKCFDLASANKSITADCVMMKENTAADAKENRKKELLAMSMSDLSNLLSQDSASAPQQTAPRQPASVPNPTLQSPEADARDNNSSNKGADIKNAGTGAKKTVDDFASEIVGKLSNR